MRGRVAIGGVMVGLAIVAVTACGDESSSPGAGASTSGEGGSAATGGAATGGAATGGAATGGAATGGAATGGAATGGVVTGGIATGGVPTGGEATGGVPTGGEATGGVPTGGEATGGVPTGGEATGGVPTGGEATGGEATGGEATGGVSTGGAGAGGTGGSTHTGPWRITPFGDSITGTTCYPKLLSKLLTDQGRTGFEFVGSVLNNQDCGGGVPNVQTEGHGGYLATQLVPGGAHASELATWCSTNQSEIVLLHYGTNDTWNSTISTPTILDAFSVILDALRGANPDVIVLVAQIIPNAACSTCGTSIPELNATIVDWAAAEGTAASPIHVVDQYTGFDPATDTGDGCHPNLPGSQKMAERWAAALAEHGLL